LIIGLLTLELFFSQSESLKDKRRLLKSIIDQTKSRFNVSVAEAGEQDRWQISLLAVVTVSNDSAYVSRILSSVEKFIERTGKAEILSVKTELR
jgi:hypothetical protein